MLSFKSNLLLSPRAYFIHEIFVSAGMVLVTQPARHLTSPQIRRLRFTPQTGKPRWKVARPCPLYEPFLVSFSLCVRPLCATTSTPLLMWKLTRESQFHLTLSAKTPSGEISGQRLHMSCIIFAHKDELMCTSSFLNCAVPAAKSLAFRFDESKKIS